MSAGLAKKILVGTDGSATAAIAVGKAAAIAAATGAELVVISAYSSKPPGNLGSSLGSDATWSATAQAAASEHVQSAISSAKSAGVDATSGDAVAGDPADVLISQAEQHGVDLIVVGNRGMQGSTRFLLGSVPNKVSHHAPCDLLIVQTT